MRVVSEDVVVRFGREPLRKLVGDGEVRYSLTRSSELARPLFKFPVGMYPFGHEWDHLTEQQIEEYWEW